MSCRELNTLVKAYTYGEIPLEVYREQRRQIVNGFTEDVTEEKIEKKADPLDSFIASTPEKPANKHKQLYFAIAGAALAVLLAIGIAIFLFPSSEQKIADTADLNPAETDSKSAAQRLAENFLRNKSWDEESINQFILDWEILSAAEKQQAHNAAWFDTFKATVQNRLDAVKKSSSQTNQQNEDLLTTLLATVDPGYFINGSFFDQKSVAQAEIPPASPTEVPASRSDTSPATPPVSAAVKKEQVKTPQKSTDQKQPPKEQIAQKQKTLPTKAPLTAQILPSTEVNKVLDRFVDNFENGNLTKLMQMFSPNASTNHHTSAEEISASYAELFQTTSKRDLKFSDFSWKPAGEQLEGNGKYLAHLNPKGTNIEQVFSADVKILLDTTSKPVTIAGLYLANQQFSTSLRPSVKAAIPAAQTIAPPEKEELRILLQNFVASYNRGDLDALMTLFSQEARTNDRSNINQIRTDYEQLFQTTKSREIVLSDVTWKFNANKAVASGLFEAKIQPKTDHKINIYRGKIRIAVTKYEGGILITQLLHNTQ